MPVELGGAMSGSRLCPYLGPLVALLVVLALGAGTVYATIPDGNGKYFACYVKNTGAVKLINYPTVKTCPKGEKLILWNAKGPQGPAGPQGVQGPKGDQGPAGASGSSDWNAIANKPAGFADGVDNGDTTRSFIAATSLAFGMAPQWGDLTVDYPVGLDVKVTLIPTKDDTYISGTHGWSIGGELFDEEYWRHDGRMYHKIYFYIYAGSGAIKARVTVWNDSYIAPAAAKRMVNASFHKGLKRPK
jgi:hypothetical protein